MVARRRSCGRAVTFVGFVCGIGACVAFASIGRWLALVLWLVNRMFDGLDGAVARVVGPTDRGGFVDIVSDFAVYGGFVVAVAYAQPDARVAAVALLCAYYVSGAAFLAWSSLAEKRARVVGDNRSLHFVGGIAEGAETIVVYVLLCVWPSATVEIVWVFTAAVAVTAAAADLVRVAGRSPPTMREAIDTTRHPSADPLNRRILGREVLGPQ